MRPLRTLYATAERPVQAHTTEAILREIIARHQADLARAQRDAARAVESIALAREALAELGGRE